MLIQPIKTLAVLLLLMTSLCQAQDQRLSLGKALKIAQHNDLWLIESYYTQKSLQSESVAAGSLPDPQIKLDFANYPTDNFDFGEDPMSQIKLSVSQMFPRGQSLALKKQLLENQSEIYAFQRLDRTAQVEVTVTHLWLEAYKAQQSIALIEQNRSLFAQLQDTVQEKYSQARAKVEQQDMVRVQLELTRLEDRLMQLQQHYHTNMQLLCQWLSDKYSQSYQNLDVVQGINQIDTLKLETQIPNIQLKKNTPFSDDEMLENFIEHPAVAAIVHQIKVAESGIDLAKQQYKPAWELHASYAYRGNTALGHNRSDLLSVGVNLDVPLFSKNRQDQQLKAAVAAHAATETKTYQQLTSMLARYNAAKIQLQQLDKRLNLYNNQLLMQMHQQAQVALTAYTLDHGDFAEVIRAKIAQLNAEIEALNITVERLKVITQINYYFVRL